MSKKIELPNVPTLSVHQVVDGLAGVYTRALNAGLSVSTLPSVMLWGPPGVGKSQGVCQLAQLIQAETGKRVDVTDVRLIMYNPVDLRGIPVASEDRTLAVWLRPKVFQMDASDDVVNILFLDEISAAPPSVQAAAYQITLDHTCGEHRLPDNCIVIAAGNRMSDRSVAYKMPKALANRLLHMEVKVEFDSWRRWAVESGVNDKIIAFLSLRPDHLQEFDASTDELAFATPRTWEMASSILDSLGGDVDLAYPLLAGLIGVGMASEFRTWARVYGQLPNIEDVFAGKECSVPKGADALYALVSAMTQHARIKKEDMAAIEHSIEYGMRLPSDFSVLLLKDYLFLEPGYKVKLMRIPQFVKWMSTKGALLNGII